MEKDIYEHILKALHEARKNKIKANTIIIDEEVAMSNELYFPYEINDNRYLETIPPMLFGLKINYMKNLTKDYDSNFIILENLNKKQTELEELREVVEILSKYFYLAECSLGSVGPTFVSLLTDSVGIKLTERENELLGKYLERRY